jgi:type I restriction enzyme R subunit
VEDNPLFDTAKAQKKLKAFVEASPKTIEVKAKIMVDHFTASVWQAKKLKGKAKAMVVTRNIECAIRYFFAIRTALKEANAPVQGAGGVLRRKDGGRHQVHRRVLERLFCAGLAR